MGLGDLTTFWGYGWSPRDRMFIHLIYIYKKINVSRLYCHVPESHFNRSTHQVGAFGIQPTRKSNRLHFKASINGTSQIDRVGWAECGKPSAIDLLHGHVSSSCPRKPSAPTVPAPHRTVLRVCVVRVLSLPGEWNVKSAVSAPFSRNRPNGICTVLFQSEYTR